MRGVRTAPRLVAWGLALAASCGDRGRAGPRWDRCRTARSRVWLSLVVPLAVRGDFGACCGGRVDRGAAAAQPDRMDPRRGRAVARGRARRYAVRAGGVGSASGGASRRLLGRTCFFALAGLLRLAAGSCVRVPRRATSIAAVAPVHDLLSRLDGPPGAVAGARGAARGAVLGRAESNASSLAGRSQLSAAGGLVGDARGPLCRRSGSPESLQALQGD